MNISRNFLVIGSVYLLLGILLGMYMGGSGDHEMAPVHAHINLLGFTLMAVFACVYKLFPAMAAGKLATVHFWLHQIGVLILIVMLFMLFTGKISEAGMAPLAPLAEALVLLGVATFAFNAFKNAS